MISVIQSSSDKRPIIMTGAVQFNDDWPGVFFTPEYIKSMITLPEKEDEPIKDAFSLSSYYLNSFYRQLIEAVDSCPVNLPVTDSSLTVKQECQIVDEAMFVEQNEKGSFNVSRVDTGLICINGYYGYFMRGDNACYMGFLLSSKKN